MKRSSSQKRRVREIEKARGAGALTITNDDGSKEGFNFSRNDRLKLLLGGFAVARASRNPDAQPYPSPRAMEVARKFAHAKEVSPPSRLWQTIAGTIHAAEQNCTKSNF